MFVHSGRVCVCVRMRIEKKFSSSSSLSLFSFSRGWDLIWSVVFLGGNVVCVCISLFRLAEVFVLLRRTKRF
jgi:hypothetical protein